jgi:carbon storage regulator
MIMLVLTRKPGETVCIGSEIELVVLDAGRGRVKLGFAGPRDVSIRRGELNAVAPTGEVELARVPHQPAIAAVISGTAPLRQFRVAAGT